MHAKPWREVAQPHQDVLDGTLKQAEFAADISAVRKGTARSEYRDPALFFERTVVTEGMRLLLDGVVRRLSGTGGDPVIQLKTSFGGGKTHTLLAVLHLAHAGAGATDLPGMRPIFAAAGVKSLPGVATAVLDGNALSPSVPATYDRVEVRTMWGELAWQLGGKKGFEVVRKADEDGTSPGKDALKRLLEAHGPAVILLDETVAYVRQFEDGKSYPGGTFDSLMSFVQALTEAVSQTVGCVLLASLPESHVELGGANGKRALEALEKFFGRVHAIWKPVSVEESWEIVRRRLFNPITDDAARDAACDAFMKLYADHRDDFPVETGQTEYRARLAACYPFHPEVFTRLFEDWSSLDNFQRTRGVLQLMAVVIHRLWKDDNRDLMITPGALPLSDTGTRNLCLHYLPHGWDPVIERDVDGERAEPTRIDGSDPRIGKSQGARRTARTVFLGSAPSSTVLHNRSGARGIERSRILLGACLPDMQPSVVTDALGRLRERLHYLNADKDRYWFDTRPNLRREMEERKAKIKFQDTWGDIRKVLDAELRDRSTVQRVHVFPDPADVPDDEELCLVVLPPDRACAKRCDEACEAARRFLDSRGTAPRINRNRLIFLAIDHDQAERAQNTVTVAQAWRSIEKDMRERRLNLDTNQQDQVKKDLDLAENEIRGAVTAAFAWLIVPVQKDAKAKTVDLELVRLGTDSRTLLHRIETTLSREEHVTSTWSPIHLKTMLDSYEWPGAEEAVSTKTIWDHLCAYPYLQRLKNRQVLIDCIAAGLVSGDYFGWADAKTADGYTGVCLGTRPGALTISSAALLLRKKVAQRVLQERAKPATEPGPGTGPGPKPVVDGGGGTVGPIGPGPTPPPPPVTSTARRFFGTIELDPITAKMDFTRVFDEVIAEFNRKQVSIKVKLELHAEADGGQFDQNFVRSISQNAKAVGCKDSEFDG